MKTKELVGKVQKLNSIKHETTPRVLTDSAEFNRVLGGGIVSGSLVLIGGDPGIGKSTLLYKFVHRYLKRKKYYILLEKNRFSQTKLRAERLDEDSSELQVLAETDLEVIYQTVKEEQPDFTSSGSDSNNISS